jgi:hypothetical protein
MKNDPFLLELGWESIWHHLLHLQLGQGVSQIPFPKVSEVLGKAQR